MAKHPFLPYKSPLSYHFFLFRIIELWQLWDQKIITRSNVWWPKVVNEHQEFLDGLIILTLFKALRRDLLPFFRRKSEWLAVIDMCRFALEKWSLHVRVETDQETISRCSIYFWGWLFDAKSVEDPIISGAVFFLAAQNPYIFFGISLQRDRNRTRVCSFRSWIKGFANSCCQSTKLWHDEAPKYPVSPSGALHCAAWLVPLGAIRLSTICPGLQWLCVSPPSQWLGMRQLVPVGARVILGLCSRLQQLLSSLLRPLQVNTFRTFDKSGEDLQWLWSFLPVAFKAIME